MYMKRGLIQETSNLVHIIVFRMIPKVNSKHFPIQHSLYLHILHYVVQTNSIQTLRTLQRCIHICTSTKTKTLYTRHTTPLFSDDTPWRRGPVMSDSLLQIWSRTPGGCDAKMGRLSAAK